MDKKTEILSLCIDLEYELRRLSLWSTSLPSPDAFASEIPFFLDTMTIPEWLQFVFLPKMHFLLEGGGELPQKCGVRAVAEEYFRGSDLDIESLLSVLGELDLQLTVEKRV